MNARNLGLLSAVALLIIVAAIWMGRSRSPDSSADQNLYPELKGKLDSVTGISIVKAGDQIAVELVREKDVWQVKQRSGYAADAGKVKSLLIRLEETKLREKKTANPANFGALSVQDVSDAGVTGVRIELAGAAVPIKLIVGKRDGTTHSTYVRRAGESQSWLVNAELDAPSDPTQWLKRDVISIGADRIQQVETQLSGSGYATLKNARADANFDVKPLPKGRELNSVTAPNSVAQALVSLQLDDVRKIDEVQKEKSSGHTKFSTFDGLIVDCTGYAIGEQRWVTFHASFDPTLAKRFYVATAAPEKKDENKDAKNPAPPAPDNSLDAVLKKGEDEASTLDQNLAAWAFAVPAYKYDAIFKPLEDLLRKPEMLKKKENVKREP